MPLFSPKMIQTEIARLCAELARDCAPEPPPVAARPRPAAAQLRPTASDDGAEMVPLAGCVAALDEMEQTHARSRKRLRDAMEAEERAMAREFAALRAGLTKGSKTAEAPAPAAARLSRRDVERERVRAAAILDGLALRLVQLDTPPTRRLGTDLEQDKIVPYERMREELLRHVEPLRESPAVNSAQVFGSTIRRCSYWRAFPCADKVLYGLVGSGVAGGDLQSMLAGAVARCQLREEMYSKKESALTAGIQFDW